jgi:adenylate cyclase
MTRSALSILAALTFVLCAYLIIQAPPPLAADGEAVASVPICTVFETTNTINENARRIYTKQIVGPGQKVGLAFDEHWKDPKVEAGPLPALFLREVASVLERDPVPLGLFLGSDAPINKANSFAPEQLELFAGLAADRKPRFGITDEVRFGMFADLASAEACVTCHNEHADTPKRDWKLNDVMGATTWTHPRSTVSAAEYAVMVEATYAAVEAAYRTVLAEFESIARPPEIAERWPGDGYAVPSAEVFMATLRAETSESILQTMLAGLDGRGGQEDCVGE